jgi:hypothetical protein
MCPVRATLTCRDVGSQCRDQGLIWGALRSPLAKEMREKKITVRPEKGSQKFIAVMMRDGFDAERAKLIVVLIGQRHADRGT